MAHPKHSLQHSLDDDKVLTFAEWCALNNIGQRSGRRIIGSGNGPVVTQLSERRIGITCVAPASSVSAGVFRLSETLCRAPPSPVAAFAFLRVMDHLP